MLAAKWAEPAEFPWNSSVSTTKEFGIQTGHILTGGEILTGWWGYGGENFMG